jgi:alpha-beta hydrolase superfamily lysophospholipase
MENLDTISFMKNVTVKTSKGTVLNGSISEPHNATKQLVIHIHGMASSYVDHNFYASMHNYYPEHDISFLVVQHSGTGASCAATERFEDCVEDIRVWVDFAISQGYSEIWLQAHSLGTPKVTYYMDQTHDSRVRGLILISPSEMIGLVHDPVGQIDYDAMYPEAKKLVSLGKPNQILSHRLWETVQLSAGTFLNFFDEGAKTAIFNYADPNLGWKVVNDLRVPVLAITGTRDDGIVTVMDTYEAMKKLQAELIHSPKVKAIVYENAEHDFIGFENNIVKDVVEFIKN